MARKNWLKDALHFTFWDRIFTRICFYKFSFFMPSFRHQDSSSYYLVLATAKIAKIWKRTSLDVYFSICKSQDRAINNQWITQPKLIDSPSDTFFYFVIAPNIFIYLIISMNEFLYILHKIYEEKGNIGLSRTWNKDFTLASHVSHVTLYSSNISSKLNGIYNFVFIS